MQATAEQQHDTLYVIAYNLPDFLAITQEHIQNGWEFDFIKNEHFPQMIGFQFVATLVRSPETTQQKVEDNTENALEDKEDATPVAQTEQPAKRGRKSKAE